MFQYTLHLLLIFYLTSFGEGQPTQCGDRPTQLINVALQCDDAVKEGIFDRIENRARGFFERAKQELGFKTEAKIQPKKCEYYKCVFERLGLINQLGLPDLSLIQTWVSTSVDAKNSVDLNSQVASCFRMLATSAINIQNDCETATRLMMCLSSADKCEVFKFP
ncbi:hypothetical protein ILUMI_07630 [Ignelater luminosus]|uniref:Uncharacterized protein n=1 Tax=Ignelater luminosus TaxID=2038154 RepID=A0A8K0GG62_IGNLU|nr:hypothetical protein ILUMI_07630 [Ignelater luminosus]